MNNQNVTSDESFKISCPGEKFLSYINNIKLCNICSV